VKKVTFINDDDPFALSNQNDN